MKFKARFKKILLKILTFKFFNRIIVSLAKLFSPLIPKGILKRVPFVGIVNIVSPNAKIFFMENDGNDHLASLLYWQGIEGFEKETIELFVKLLPFSNVILDIGANTGIYSLIAAIDNPKRSVYAFEPVPNIVRYLRQNIEINGLDNIHVEVCALNSYDGDSTLYLQEIAGDVPTTSSTAEGHAVTSAAISVKSVRLDAFVTQTNIPTIGLIKIDTEATEHEVLKGAKEVLRRDNPIIICEVLHGKTENFLHSLLDEFQYNYFWISDNGLIRKDRIEGDPRGEHLNYLFITNEKLNQVSDTIGVS